MLSGAFVLAGIAVIAGNAPSGNSTAMWIGGGVILIGSSAGVPASSWSFEQPDANRETRLDNRWVIERRC